jgi:hypothetical protein
MSKDINTIDDVFAALGGVTSVARSLNVNYSTASEMKRRKSIPSHRWVELDLTKPADGWPVVTHAILAKVHAAEAATKQALKAAKQQEPAQ